MSKMRLELVLSLGLGVGVIKRNRVKKIRFLYVQSLLAVDQHSCH
jgi:hypothetical protein